MLDVRWNSHIARDQFRVIGTGGVIDRDPLSGPRLLVNGVEEQWPTHDNVHYPLIENFVDAIAGRGPLVCSGEEALWTDWVTEQCAPIACTPDLSPSSRTTEGGMTGRLFTYALLATAAAAQTARFEVASVKECRAGEQAPPSISSPQTLSLHAGTWGG